MACHGSNSQSEPAKVEQIITEFFAKSLHIVLESRCPYMSSRNYSGEQIMSSPSSSSSSSSSVRPRDKWFNLALKECPAALENIDFWRQSNVEPMVVDVILVQRFSDLKLWNVENDETGPNAKTEKIIERWVLKYETRKGGRDCNTGNKRSSAISSPAVYKKSILLFRSLYSMVRLLPAYKLFRDLNSSFQIPSFNLAHKVSSFVEPFTSREESEMQTFTFTPVETFCGRLCLSVSYHSSLLDVNSEPSTPMTPKFITDYVGSPLADPLKRLPSLSSPFGRRHSWSYDVFSRASPPSGFPSPSPAYSDSHSIHKSNSHRLPPASAPRCYPESHPNHKINTKCEINTNFDEYWPSPIYSPSPSPSPPAKTFRRSESTPVSIPQSKLSNAPLTNIKQYLPNSPPLKDTRTIVCRTEINPVLIQTRSAVEKSFGIGKMEAGRHIEHKISLSNSLQKSYSGSSSRLSFQDDFDDIEFSGPFVVDDDEVTDPSSRSEYFDQKGNQSRNNAVGALVHMLTKAPPLSHGISNSINAREASKKASLDNQGNASLSIVSSGLVIPKTTSDALEELKAYREMKDSMIRQGTRSKS